jgi:glutamate N-acetyltransferase / amino-acid N-acetyltransferase
VGARDRGQQRLLERRDGRARRRGCARHGGALHRPGVGCSASEVLVASTGVIGQPLPMGASRAGIPKAAGALRPDGLPAAARAIMTTDTCRSSRRSAAASAAGPVTLAGIAKGAGMIEPDMATMLSFLVTDAAVTPPLLRRLLRGAADVELQPRHRRRRDSTSDTVLLLANGAPGIPAARPGERRARRARPPRSARSRGARPCDLPATARARRSWSPWGRRRPRRRSEAERAARRIANSVLVKTALFGGDPNWGRILQTIGAGRVAPRSVPRRGALGGVVGVPRGGPTGAAARRRAGRALRAPEVEVAVELGAGRHRRGVDLRPLSYDYVRINAEYTT